MGDYLIKIHAYGRHGCVREIKDGGTIYGCGRIGCPDCETREFLKRLAAQGSSLKEATLTHWPGEASEVQDDLLTRVRKGSF